ncbi:MAG: hypothetical protein Q8N51_20855, partial [Gammaproteobacteria bacterium]|nr:hypothetical protein [Gammaproteobacteria bacterium]
GNDNTGTFSETVGALSLLGGSNLVYSLDNNAASNTLTFGSFATRAVGSTLVFDTVTGTTASGTIAFTAAPTQFNGIIGGWAIRSTSNDGNTLQLREWATMTGNVVTALAAGGYTATGTNTAASDGWLSTHNVKVNDASQTLTLGSRTIHSLNIQSTTGRSITINSATAGDVNRTLIINSGGILSTQATHTIAGGKLTAGTHTNSLNPYELIFHLPTNQLNVTSVITNNGANAVSLVKNGSSVLDLNPSLSLSTSRTAGFIRVDMASSNNTAGLTVGAVVTGAGILPGTVVESFNATQVFLSQAPITTGTSNLTYSLANTYTGKTYLNEGTLQITRESALGANPGSFVADQLIMNGGILRATATFGFNSNRGITLGQADGFFRVANNQALTLSSTNVINGTGGRLFFAADASSRGV